jgi:hypothetical protein
VVVDQPIAVAPVESPVIVDPPIADPPVEPAKPTDWRDRRIAQLTAQLYEAKAKAVAVGTPEPTAPVVADSAEFERRVSAEAEVRAQTAEFNRACNEVADIGRAAFTPAVFNARVAEITKLVNGSDSVEVARYNQFLSAAIETGEGAKLLHGLGGDLNEAARIMALSPVKMAIALAKLAGASTEPVVTPGNSLSGAPRPITPIGSRASNAADISPSDPDRSDALTTSAWMAKREKEAEAAAKARMN